MAAAAYEWQKHERLCRYINRPAIAEQRLTLAALGWVHYQLKTPYRDGTTHVLHEPLDFIACCGTGLQISVEPHSLARHLCFSYY